MPYLRLAHSEQRLLVAKVDLDLPAPHVMLHDALERKMRIADDQISRLAIEQLGARARPVGQRRDHHQAQIPLPSGRTPAQRRQRLDAKAVDFAGRPGLDRFPLDVFVAAQLLRRRSTLAIESSRPRAAAGGGAGRW